MFSFFQFFLFSFLFLFFLLFFSFLFSFFLFFSFFSLSLLFFMLFPFMLFLSLFSFLLHLFSFPFLPLFSLRRFLTTLLLLTHLRIHAHGDVPHHAVRHNHRIHTLLLALLHLTPLVLLDPERRVVQRVDHVHRRLRLLLLAVLAEVLLLHLARLSHHAQEQAHFFVFLLLRLHAPAVVLLVEGAAVQRVDLLFCQPRS